MDHLLKQFSVPPLNPSILASVVVGTRTCGDTNAVFDK